MRLKFNLIKSFSCRDHPDKLDPAAHHIVSAASRLLHPVCYILPAELQAFTQTPDLALKSDVGRLAGFFMNSSRSGVFSASLCADG